MISPVKGKEVAGILMLVLACLNAVSIQMISPVKGKSSLTALKMGTDTLGFHSNDFPC
jgi:hypothetical protein